MCDSSNVGWFSTQTVRLFFRIRVSFPHCPLPSRSVADLTTFLPIFPCVACYALGATFVWEILGVRLLAKQMSK